MKIITLSFLIVLFFVGNSCKKDDAKSRTTIIGDYANCYYSKPDTTIKPDDWIPSRSTFAIDLNKDNIRDMSFENYNGCTGGSNPYYPEFCSAYVILEIYNDSLRVASSDSVSPDKLKKGIDLLEIKNWYKDNVFVFVMKSNNTYSKDVNLWSNSEGYIGLTIGENKYGWIHLVIINNILSVKEICMNK